MTKRSQRQIKELKVAKLAFEQVNDVMQPKNKKENQKNYRSYARKLPAMIQMNGLASTMAFYHAKSNKNAYKKMMEHIQAFFIEEGFLTNEAKGHDQVLETILNCESSKQYREITTSLLHYASYLSRFAEGLYEDE
ncbi:type III-B CRISPR module-associated protein Cmr5 [Bacillaceae bacterium SIJ1]|uniref:type III-B CRISPR module-associated protein Cmr5 n=1 Tax=Litoribacterium kuwaitense TaxID=1398745 RepID=UPI0013EB98AF|nr:type III-B CRISPR module-associated protein Cmr5 [Litoribacterium kuwaitense]NGP44606.1 type III-B CRISPR module-associated protein Cmr5 [Litoribacterium kuwaitense]